MACADIADARGMIPFSGYRSETQRQYAFYETRNTAEVSMGTRRIPLIDQETAVIVKLPNKESKHALRCCDGGTEG